MAFGKGSRGAGVKELQRALDSWIKNANEEGNDTGLIGVIADGAFGQNTHIALATYQRMTGTSSPTGYADDETLESLGLTPGMDANGMLTIDSTGAG